MKGKEAMYKAGEGGLIKLVDKSSKIHLVWRGDRGLLRICRPKMLDDTGREAAEEEWETVVGKPENPVAFDKIAKELGYEACLDCCEYGRFSS